MRTTSNSNGLTLNVSASGSKEVMESLNLAREVFEDSRELNEAIALTVLHGGTSPQGKAFRGMQEHIFDAAKTRHTTAEKLGVAPTGYLNKAAASLEANGVSADAASAILSITESWEIFKRTFGEVEVRIKERKWLAIPCDPRTFNRSPLNFEGWLDFIVLVPEVLAVWVMRDKPKVDKIEEPEEPEKPETEDYEPTEISKPLENVVFIGRKFTRLTKDEGLLPTEQEFYHLITLGINLELQRVLNLA